MFSAKAIHLLHLFVRGLSIAIVFLLGLLFFGLIRGIEIDRFEAKGYEVEGLYIKLDKKLTLKADKLTLPRVKADPSFGRVDKTFDSIKYILTFFDSIMLERIDFQNNRYTFLYADDVLYITNDTYEIAGNIIRMGSKLTADVAMLYIKKEDVHISGKLSYDLKKNALDTQGTFEAYGVRGNFSALQQHESIVYAVRTDRFTNLVPLIKRFHMHSVIESWIIDRVKAKSYRLDYLKGRIFVHGEEIRPDFATLKGMAHLEDVTIRYHDAIEPARAEGLILSFGKGDLNFRLQKPFYRNKDLNGTSVVIKHIIGPIPPFLVLDLHVKGSVDKSVQEILSAYRLQIPVEHSGMQNRVVVNLKIPLGKQDKKIKATVDAVLDQGELRVGDFSFHIDGGSVLYENGVVALQGVSVKEPWFEGKVQGSIVPSKREAALKLHVRKARLAKGYALRGVKGKTVPVKLNYRKGLRVAIASLGVNIDRNEKGLYIEFSDLGKVVPMLPPNMLAIKGGHISLRTEDYSIYRFKGMLEKERCFFYGKSGVCYTKIPVTGEWNARKATMKLYAFDKRLRVDLNKRLMKVTDLNIDLKRILEALKKEEREGRKSEFRGKPFVILGERSNLRYKSYRLVLDSYDIEIAPSGNIEAMGILDGDVVKFTRKGKRFFIQALRVKDKLLHPLINFKGLKGGRYSLKKEGDPDRVMKGRIIIEGGVLSDFKAYSNTLALINTIPALATLHSPGFSKKGFKIKEGVIEYTMTPEKITFTSVYLKGNSATVVGKGDVYLESGKLDIDLAILTVRELGSIVGKIPLLGYILMGEDNSMTVGLKVTGTLNDPKVRTSVAEDILTLPFRILKRTLTSPAHLGTHPQKSSKKQK